MSSFREKTSSRALRFKLVVTTDGRELVAAMNWRGLYTGYYNRDGARIEVGQDETFVYYGAAVRTFEEALQDKGGIGSK